jgi:hypothetical protein
MPGATGGDLFDFFKGSSAMGFMLVSSHGLEKLKGDGLLEHGDERPVESFLKPFSVRDITDRLTHFLGLLGPSNQTQHTQGRMRIAVSKISMINGQGGIEAALYLKLSSTKMIKFANNSQDLGSERIEELRQRGVRHLYLDSQDFEKFLEKLISDFEVFTGSGQEASDHAKNIELIGLYLQNLGVSDKLCQKIDMAHQNMIKTLSSGPRDDRALLGKLQEILNSAGPLAQHALITSYLCAQMIEHLTALPPSALEKLTQASLFCDMGHDDDDAFFITDINAPELALTPVSRALRKRAREDLQASLDIYKSTSLFNPDVARVIAQHHERPDGSGFPHGLQAKELTPLALVFIFCSSLAYQIIEAQALSKEAFNKDDLIVDKMWQHPSCKKILEAHSKAFTL